MKVDIEDVLFWMDAIRNSDDRYRTLESFWKGQVRSKLWLIENLSNLLPQLHSEKTIAIYGGWNGVLASLIFNSGINVKKITSIDIDPTCEDTACTINKRQEIEGRFNAVTADMADYTMPADIVINTSCEHITQEQYNQWIGSQPNDALFVLQSNNYFDLDEHINCVNDTKHFELTSQLNKLVYTGDLELPKYTRFMLIGYK